MEHAPKSTAGAQARWRGPREARLRQQALMAHRSARSAPPPPSTPTSIAKNDARVAGPQGHALQCPTEMDEALASLDTIPRHHPRRGATAWANSSATRKASPDVSRTRRARHAYIAPG